METITNKVSRDRDVLMCACTREIAEYMEKNNLLDNGYPHMYDMIADIVDEFMAGDEYKKYLMDYNHFHKLGTSFDWYYMDRCVAMITEERMERVAFPSRYAWRNGWQKVN